MFRSASPSIYISLSLCAFWNLLNDQHTDAGLILLNNRLVIAVSMRPHVLRCIHIGAEKSKCARACVHWSAMCSDIEREVKQCAVCDQYSNTNQKEYFCHTYFLHIHGRSLTFLLLMENTLWTIYYSKWYRWKATQFRKLLQSWKCFFFAQHWIPKTVIDDNISFSSIEFSTFQIITCHPANLWSNSLVERQLNVCLKGSKRRQRYGDEFRNTPITGLDEPLAQLRYLVDKSWKHTTRVKKHDTPRSYHIQTHQAKETDIT